VVLEQVILRVILISPADNHSTVLAVCLDTKKRKRGRAGPQWQSGESRIVPKQNASPVLLPQTHQSAPCEAWDSAKQHIIITSYPVSLIISNIIVTELRGRVFNTSASYSVGPWFKSRPRD
jgi:hypothetical protein